MKKILIVVVAFFVWSIGLGAGAFFYGKHVQSNADQASQLKDEKTGEAVKDAKNKAATDVGVAVEKNRDRTEKKFSKLRSDYEIEQRKNSAIGCVLDPVSMRVWNVANQKPSGDAAGQPDD